MSISETASTSLSPQQTDTLRAFREQLFAEGILHEGDSIGTDDKTLLRFLRARKFNLNDAKKMLTSCQHWRQTVSGVGIDELKNKIDLFDYPLREEVFKSWSMYFHKTDKKGRPVNIQSLGGFNLPELYKHITQEELVEFVIVNAEFLTSEIFPAASRAVGHHIDQSLVIVDLKGFGLSQFWQVKSIIQVSFQISQDYYPEAMGQLAIINAPPSFTFIWSVIKPWLSKETVEKVDILGKDYEDVLLQIVDADSLPTTLGGNCTCSDAGGCQLSSAGPWMEERLTQKTVTNSVGSSESNTPAQTPSEWTRSSITQVEGNVEQVNVVHEKVIDGDLTTEVVVTTAHLEVS